MYYIPLRLEKKWMVDGWFGFSFLSELEVKTEVAAFWRLLPLKEEREEDEAKIFRAFPEGF